MDESRIDAVWRHMAQMFGADALQRKFGDTPPDDWRQFVSKLSDHELRRGLRRMLNSGKSFPPTLPEFLKMAHEVGGDYPGDERYQAKQLPAPANNLDGWSAMAGQHLMAHILRCAQNREYFDSATTQPLVDAKNLWAEEMRDADKAGKLPPDHGKSLWRECLRKANLSISHIRQSRNSRQFVA